MEEISAFERVMKKINKKIIKLQNEYMVTDTYFSRRDMKLTYESALHLEDAAEKLVLLTRVLPEYTGNPRAKADVNAIIRERVPVEMGFTKEGWFALYMLSILPIKDLGSSDYLRFILYPALSEFFKNLEAIRYPESVVIYRHVNSRDRPGRRKRDYDNIETKYVTDMVALYLLPDDDMRYCSKYECSVEGNENRTEVYVVPKNDFEKWVKMEKSMPETGWILHEKPENYLEKHMSKSAKKEV